MKFRNIFLALLLFLFGFLLFRFLMNSHSLSLPGYGKYQAADSIVESNAISDIFNYINPDEYNKDTLVIFDIDNTLIAPKTDMGSDQWFYALFHKQMETGLSAQDAILSIMPLYTQILNETPFYPIEPQTVSVVEQLQSKGVSVIALTARSFDLAFRTVEQLHEAGIYFARTDPHACPIENVQGRKQEGLYMNGIIFSGSYSKGEMIEDWLQKIHYKPKKIIFVDDKIKNVKSVEEPLHRHNYPFIGIRYGYLDERVKNFDWDTTQKEVEEFFKNNPELRPVPAL